MDASSITVFLFCLFLFFYLSALNLVRHRSFEFDMPLRDYECDPESVGHRFFCEVSRSPPRTFSLETREAKKKKQKK